MEPRFNPFYFADMAEHRGWRFAWYKAIKCPCVSKYEGGAKKDCAVCGGSGSVYSNAVEGKATVGTVNEKRTWQIFGELREGDMTIAIPYHVLSRKTRPFRYSVNPMYDIGENDMVVLLDSEIRCNAMVAFAAGAKVRHQRPVRVIQAVVIVNGQKQEIPPAEVGLNGNVIDWHVAGIPANTPVSIQYTARPEYLVRGELAAEKRPGNVRLPRRLLLRLKDSL